MVLPISILPVDPRRYMVRSSFTFTTFFFNSLFCFLCSIIGSLAGTSYYGPVAGHGLISHDLQLIRAERKKAQPERSGVVAGDTEALLAGDDSDNYVKITKKGEEEEEGQQKEGEGEGGESGAADDKKGEEKKD